MSDQDRPTHRADFMAGGAALQERLVVVNALKARRCQKTFRAQATPVRLWSVMQGRRPEILSEWVSTRSSPREANLLLARWKDRALDVKYGLAHHARRCQGHSTRTFHRSRGAIIVRLSGRRDGRVCRSSALPGAPPAPGFGCLGEMLSQIFIESPPSRVALRCATAPRMPLSCGVDVFTEKVRRARMNRIGKQSGSR